MDSLAAAAEPGEEGAREKASVKPRRMLAVADALSAGLALGVAVAVLLARGDFAARSGMSILMGGLVLLVALGMMARAGQYTNRHRMSRLVDSSQLTRSLIIAFAGVALAEYLTKGFFTGQGAPSRLAVGAFLLTFFILGVVSRIGLSAYQRRLFARGFVLRKILLVGDGQAARDFVSFVEGRPWLGVGFAGRIAYETSSGSDPGMEATAPMPGPPVVGRLSQSFEGLKDLDRALRSSGASEVVVALDPEDQVGVAQITGLLSLAHVPFKVIPTLFEQTFQSAELSGYAELPVIDVDVDPLDRVARLFKRSLDVTVASLAIVIGVPLGLAIFAAIAIESGLPIIYKQERVGKNGHHFCLYKYRTMVQNAHQQLNELQDQNEACDGGQMFKMHKDPRVTRVGAILRKLSLDELPQLINVLKGEMSLVGPRPPLPEEVEHYQPQHYSRLKGLPGITGLWQVSGRSRLSFDDMVRLDRYYLDNWSLKLDLSILLKTVYVVLARKGAY